MDKSSTTVAIPATIEQAIGALNGIDALLTAKGWERAAIVYAFTTNENEGGNPDPDGYSPGSIPIRAFAALGIAGLTTRDTVRLYREAWIEGGGNPLVEPGGWTILPTGKFPPRDDTNFGSRVSPAKAKETVEGWSPEAKAEAVKALIADDEITDAVVDELVHHPGLVDEAEGRLPRVTTPTAPEAKLNGSFVQLEVQRRFERAHIEIEAANDLLSRAINEGVAIDDLAFDAMADYPELWIDEIIVLYRKVLAMVPTRVME